YGDRTSHVAVRQGRDANHFPLVRQHVVRHPAGEQQNLVTPLELGQDRQRACRVPATVAKDTVHDSHVAPPPNGEARTGSDETFQRRNLCKILAAFTRHFGRGSVSSRIGGCAPSSLSRHSRRLPAVMAARATSPCTSPSTARRWPRRSAIDFCP